MTRTTQVVMAVIASALAIALVITALVLFPWGGPPPRDPQSHPTAVGTPPSNVDEENGDGIADETETDDETQTDDETEHERDGNASEDPSDDRGDQRPGGGVPDQDSGDQEDPGDEDPGEQDPGDEDGGDEDAGDGDPKLPSEITWDEAGKRIEIATDGIGLVVDYGAGVVVNTLAVDTVGVLDAANDSSRIAVTGREPVSAADAENIHVTPSSDGIKLAFDIPLGDGVAHETWTFDPRGDAVAWAISREYSIPGSPLQIAATMGDLMFERDAWQNVRRPEDGGNVPVWGDRLVEAAAVFTEIDGLGRNGILLESAPNHAVFDTGDLVFLTHERPTGLSVDVTADGHVASTLARRGTPSAADGLAAGWRLADDGFEYANGNAKGYASRFSEDADRALIRPEQVSDGHRESAEFVLSAVPSEEYYAGIELEGIDSQALSEIVNDFGRTIVQGATIGASSERSFRAGEAPGFTSPWNVWSLELLQDDGAFESMRHQFSDIFALPKRDPAAPNEPVNGELGGLQDAEGRIHCCVPFGHVNSSQPTYATTDNTFNVVFSVSTLYNLDPDVAWLEAIAPSVRLALEYAERELLVRSGPTQGLFANSQCADPQSPTGCFTDWSEWNDQYDIGQVSAYHNVFAYAALTKWAELEREVLGSASAAAHYETLAAGVQERYNAAADDGGFWSAESDTFAYTRDETGALVKDCSHLFANGYALMFDLVESDARQLTVAASLRDEYERLATVGHVYDHGAHGGTDYTWKVHGSNPRSCGSGETLENGWPRMYFPFFEDGGAHLLNEQPAAQISLTLGDRSRNVDYARTVVERYAVDGFMGWSNIQPDTLKPRRDIWQEPFMVNNVLGVWALYHDVLGFQPHHDGLNILPFIDESLVGSSVDYLLRGTDTVSVKYESTDRYRIAYDGEESVRVGWQREPHGQYQLTVDGENSLVLADSEGHVWVDVLDGSHSYELGGRFGVTYDDDVLEFSDGWDVTAGSAYLGESMKVSSTAGETAKLSFTGTGATLLVSTGPAGGIAGITLDGVALDAEDWYAPTTSELVRLVRVSGLEPGEHELTVTVAGDHSPPSSGQRIGIDGVVIFGGAPTPPDPDAPTDVEVHPSTFTYTGGWWGVADPAYLSGELRGTSEAGATATLAFTGTGVTLSGSTGGDKGLATILIDGEEVTTADWYAATPANRQTLFSVQDLEPGPHVLEVVVLGEKSSGSVGVQVNLDGAIVRTGGAPPVTTMAPGEFDYTGDWWGVADPAYLTGELRGTSQPGATVTVAFTGTGVAISGSTGGDKGRASVSVDGGPPTVVDWYAAVPANRVTLFSVADLSPGEHTMVVTVLGEHDPASVGNQVNLDGAIVTH